MFPVSLLFSNPIQFGLTLLANPFNLIIFFVLLALAAGMAEEPEWERILRRYIVTNNEIIKIEGLFTKKKTVIPYQTVADIRVTKTPLGRILNYGTVLVGGFKQGDDIVLKGMRNPDEVYRVIQNKVNLLREKQMGVTREHQPAVKKKK